MSLDTAEKQELIKTHQVHATDTGSAEVQVAMLSKRISKLNLFNLVDGIKKYSRALIADKIGQSSSQMARLLFIDKHRPDIIKAIDKDELSIRAGYYWVKRDLEEKNSRIDKPKVKQTNINGWRVYIKSSWQFI